MDVNIDLIGKVVAIDVLIKTQGKNIASSEESQTLIGVLDYIEIEEGLTYVGLAGRNGRAVVAGQTHGYVTKLWTHTVRVRRAGDGS